MISKTKTGWAALGAIGLLTLGAAGCAYDNYGDYRGGGWGRHDRDHRADRDHRPDRSDRGPRRDRDRDRDRDDRDGRDGRDNRRGD